MKIFLFLLFILSLNLKFFGQNQFNTKFRNETNIQTFALYPTHEGEFLSFIGYECTSLQINHIKNNQLLDAHIYGEEVLREWIYKCNDSGFFLLGIFSAHDFPSETGSVLIHSNNYQDPKNLVSIPYGYQDFTFYNDSTLLAIAKYDYTSRKEIDEWHLLNLQGKIMEKILPFIPKAVNALCNKDNVVMADKDSIFLLQLNTGPYFSAYLPEITDLHLFRDSVFVAHQSMEKLLFINNHDLKIIESHPGTIVNKNNKDNLFYFLDDKNQILQADYQGNEIAYNFIVNASDTYYNPMNLVYAEDEFITFGTDKFSYGNTEYRYFSKENGIDTLYNVSISMSDPTLTLITDTINSPIGEIYLKKTLIHSEFTLTNLTPYYSKVLVNTRGLGGAFCFSFEKQFTVNLNGFETKTIVVSHSVDFWTDKINLCYYIPSVNGKIDIDNSDNFACSLATGDSISIYKNKKHVYVFPNPAMECINVSQENQFKEFTIFTTTGVKIKESRVSDISISDLPSGNYLLRCLDIAGNAHTTKFIKL